MNYRYEHYVLIGAIVAVWAAFNFIAQGLSNIKAWQKYEAIQKVCIYGLTSQGSVRNVFIQDSRMDLDGRISSG